LGLLKETFKGKKQGRNLFNFGSYLNLISIETRGKHTKVNSSSFKFPTLFKNWGEGGHKIWKRILH